MAQLAPDLTFSNVDMLVDANANGVADGGETIRYELRLTNEGPGDTTGLILSDVFEPNLALVADSVKAEGVLQGAVVEDADLRGFEIRLDRLPAGQTLEVMFEALVDPSLPVTTLFLANQAQVDADSFPDPLLSDDPHRATTNADPTLTPANLAPSTITANLSVTASVNGFIAFPGETLLYSASISNLGRDPVTSVEYADSIAHVTIQPNVIFDPPVGTVINAAGQDLRVQLGTLLPGETIDIFYDAMIDPGIPDAVKTIDARGTVTGLVAATVPFLPVRTVEPAFNGRFPVTQIAVARTTAGIDLAMRMSALVENVANPEDPCANAGDLILYQVEIINIGDTDFPGGTFTDVLPRSIFTSADRVILPGRARILTPTTVKTIRSPIAQGPDAGPGLEAVLALIPARGGRALFTYVAEATGEGIEIQDLIEAKGKVFDSSDAVLATASASVCARRDPDVQPVISVATTVIDTNADELQTAGDTMVFEVTIVNLGVDPAYNLRYTDFHINSIEQPASIEILDAPAGTTASFTLSTPVGFLETFAVSGLPVSLSIPKLEGFLKPGDSATIRYAVTARKPVDLFGFFETTEVESFEITGMPSLHFETLSPPRDPPLTIRGTKIAETFVVPPPEVSMTLRDTGFDDFNEDGLLNPGEIVHYELLVSVDGDRALRKANLELFTNDKITLSGFAATTTLSSPLGVRAPLFGGDVNLSLAQAIIPGETLTITFRGFALEAEAETFVVCQGSLRRAGDTTPLAASDDPDTAEALDPTATPLTPLPPVFDRVWALPENGLWSDPSKWDPAGVPLAGENVLIDATGVPYTVTVNIDPPGEVEVDSSDATLSVIPGRLFGYLVRIVDGQLDTQGTTFDDIVVDPKGEWDSSGTTVVNGSLENHGETRLTGGTISVNGNGPPVSNTGKLKLRPQSFSGSRLTASNRVLENGYGGEIEVEASAPGSPDPVNRLQAKMIDNAGGLRVQEDAQVELVTGFDEHFYNRGEVEIGERGELKVTSSTTWHQSGQLFVAPDASLRSAIARFELGFEDGNTTCWGDITVPSARYEGGSIEQRGDGIIKMVDGLLQINPELARDSPELTIDLERSVDFEGSVPGFLTLCLNGTAVGRTDLNFSTTEETQILGRIEMSNDFPASGARLNGGFGTNFLPGSELAFLPGTGGGLTVQGNFGTQTGSTIAVHTPGVRIGSAGRDYDLGGGLLVNAEDFGVLGNAVTIRGDVRGSGGIRFFAFEPRFVGGIHTGNSPGILDVIQDVALDAPSVFVAEIAGTAPGQFDQLLVDGDVVLGGLLSIVPLPGYTPAAGDTFKIIAATGRLSGDFAFIEGTSISPRFSFIVEVLPQAVRLSVAERFVADDPEGDFDGDGMPNQFENDTPGLDPFNPLDASSDADMDGQSAGQEAAFGADPNDPSSRAPRLHRQVDFISGEELVASYLIPALNPGWVPVPLLSEDLETWSPLDPSLVGFDLSASGNIELMFQIPDTNPLFLDLDIQREPLP